MSKELIEELRANAAALDGDLPGLLMLAADALEAKAAPVGERLVVTVVDPDCRTTTEHVITERDVILLWNRIDTLERQQAREVVMPDVSAMAKVLSDRAADACNINRDDNWAMYGQEYIDDVQAMLGVARLNGKEVGRG